MTRLYTTEHRTTTYVSGPLLIAEHAEHVAYDELVEVVTPSGERRRGQVLEIEGDRMVVQVLGGTRGLDIDSTAVLVRARAARMPVGPDLVGRILDGMGRPADGGPELLPEAERDLNGRPVNPVAREHPAEFIETGSRRSTGCIRSSAARSCRSSRDTACRGSNWLRRSRRARACPHRTRASSWSSPRSA